MHIVLYTPNFPPLTGGLENTALDLATAFSELGHTVTVVTLTASEIPEAYPFRVLRRAGLLRQIAAMRRADAVLMLNVSLKGLLPCLLSGRPLVVSHQTPNTTDWRGRLKARVANRLAARNIGCSTYMADPFARAVPIPNPYDNTVFRNTEPWVFRRRDLVFVGRLVSDKGADLLLEALAMLRANGPRPDLTIVGDGPEREPLRQQAEALGVADQVTFAGVKKGAELAALLNEHRIMVAPSVWAEPFGIVALEGLACGCIVVASSGGGLPEALGGHGVLFPNGDVRALAGRLLRVLERPLDYLPDPDKLAEHLRRHERGAVAQAYLEVLSALG